MFPAFSINQTTMVFSSNEYTSTDSEDDHYEEDDECSILDDGIILDQSIVDEYEDFEDEMESDIPEPEDSEIIDHLNFIDEVEAEHYDSLDDE